MKTIYILFSGLLLLVQCDRKDQPKEKIIGEFPVQYELEGEPVFEDEYSLAQIVAVDSLILITAGRDTLFHLYNKNEEKVSAFGRTGRGPNELMRIYGVEDVVEGDSVTKVFMLDDIRKELVRINMTASMDSNTLNVENRLPLPDKLTGAMDFLSVTQDKFIGVYDDHFYKKHDEKRGGFFYNQETDSIEFFDVQNVEISPYEDMAATNINARMPAISPNREKVVIAMTYYPKLTIMDTNNGTQLSLFLEDSLPPKTIDLDDYNQGNVKEYTSFVSATDNYIYLLYSGLKMNAPQSSKHILVIDWEGNPHVRYKIPPSYDFSMFLVDEEKEQFYGLSYANDAIYRFDYAI